MKTVNLILIALLLSVCIAFVVKLIPNPGEVYPIPSCEGKEDTYRPEKGDDVIRTIVVRSLCLADRNRDDISMGATVVIAIFTIILGIYTSKMFTATKMAAEAARDSAAVIPTLERPFIFIQTIIQNIMPPQHRLVDPRTQATEPVLRQSIVKVSIVNNGRTPASITSAVIMADFRIVEPPSIGESLRLNTATSETKKIYIVVPRDEIRDLPESRTIPHESPHFIGTRKSLNF